MSIEKKGKMTWDELNLLGDRTTALETDMSELDQDLNTPTFTTISEFARAIDVPTTVKNGHISDNNGNALEFSGLTLVNSVINGDFSDGITGWDSGNVTGFTQIGGVAEFTATAANGNIYKEVSPSGNYASKKVFFSAKVATSASVIKLVLSDGVGQTEIICPASPTLTDVYGIRTVSASSTLLAIFLLDPRTSGWTKTFADEFTVVNMTALGIESYTEAQMLALVQSGYIDGMQSIENLVVDSVGKNLVDKNNLEFGSFSTTTGELQPSTGNIRNINLIRVEPSTTYVVNLDWRVVAFFDSNETFISSSAVSGAGTFATPTNCYYIRNRSFNGLSDLETFKNIIQLEKGTVATSYESYKSSQATLPTTARRVPNGVADDVYFANGKAWKLKDIEEKTLTSTDFTALVTSPTNYDYVNMTKPIDSKINGNVVNFGTDPSAIHEDFRPIVFTTDISAVGGMFIQSSTAISLVVTKGTYANLAEAQADLTGTKIQYQLATPVLEEINTVADLELFEDGTITQVGDNGLFSTLSIEAPTNLKAVQIGNSRANTAISNALQKLL